MPNRSIICLVFVMMVASMGCQQLPVRSVQDSLEGSYDTESRYDMSTFSGIFGGLAGEWRQPDQLIYNQITGRVATDYGSTSAAAFETIYGARLQADIQDYLANETPPWVMQIGGRLDQVDAQMKTVDLQTTMLMTEPEPDAIEATQIWNGVAFFKEPACRDSSAITCDQFQLSSEELLDAEYPVEVLSSDFTATAQNREMQMNAHSLDFNYGRLGLYLLVNQILPDNPTEGVGLRDVALGAINCRGLAGRITDEQGALGVDVGGTTIGISLNDLVGDCQSGVLASVNGFVDRFEVPVGMDLTGSAQLVDTNRDGKIDQFTSGQVGGDMALQLLNGQAEEGPVSGQFIGFRVGDLP